jgi:hypothetical protein
MPRRKSALPAPEELLEQADELFDDARDRNQMYDALDEIYAPTEHAAGQPAAGADNENVQLVKMPYGTSAVDLVADLAANQEVLIEVPASKETDSAQKTADAQERWLRALLQANGAVQGKKNLLVGHGAWLAAMRAACVMRVLYLDHAVTQPQGADKYLVTGLPLLLQNRDARNCVYAEGGYQGIDFVAERSARSVRQLRRLYPAAFPDEDRYPDGATAQWTEVWTPQHVAYFVDGRPVRMGGQKVRAHGYGCLPYAIGLGRTTPVERLKYRPLLEGVRTVGANLNTVVSILATAGWHSAVDATNVFSDDYGTANDKRQVDANPGAINYFGRADRVEAYQRAPLPQDFFRLLDAFLAAYQQGTFPFAMFGQVGTAMAGYAINLLTQSGRRALAPIMSAVEGCLEGILRCAAIVCREKLAPLVGPEIPLQVPLYQNETDEQRKARRVRRELRLDTRAIGDDWQCTVSLGDVMPADEAANLRMALEATNARLPLLSVQTALTKFKIVPDAADELTRIGSEAMVRELGKVEQVKVAVERGLLPPEVLERMQQETAAKYGLGEPGAAPPPPPPELAAGMPPGAPMSEAQLVAPQGGVAGQDMAGLQAMAGQPRPPTLAEMAGTPPVFAPFGGNAG